MAQVLIGRKEDVLLGQLLHDLDGIGRRDADVGRRLDRCRRIDVTDDGQIVVLGAGLFDRRRVGHVGHRTGRRRIGHEDLLLRIEHLALSPIKSTPAKTMILASVSTAFLARPKESPTKSA